MRGLLVALTCMVLAGPVTAGLSNGDWSAGETDWTQWRAPWGGGENWLVTSNGPTPLEGTLYLPAGNASFGWYQKTTCPVGWICTVNADWAGDISGAGWAEVMLWSTPDPLEDAGGRADVGNAGDIAFKNDSWGMNPPTAWVWQPASLSPYPLGNGGTVVSQGTVVVALKLGGFSPPEWVSFDNIVLTCVPEPTSLLLLGLPLMLLRRR